MPVTSKPQTALSKTTVALVGNPNTGKTTLFNALTGFRQRVGNYPGVTVERRTGLIRGGNPDQSIEVADLPGAYSLSASAEDEIIVLDVLLGRQPSVPRPDLIICVVDATNLTRNLFFTTQILELGRPVVVALNMTDLARTAGVQIDVDRLADALGVPVVPIVANRGEGVESLKSTIAQTLGASASDRCPSFPDCVCAELDGLCQSVADHSGEEPAQAERVEVLQTLLGPGSHHEDRLVRRCGLGMADELAERRRRIQLAGESLAEVEARVRYAWIDRVTRDVVSRSKPFKPSRSARADQVLTHPIYGLTILMLILSMCFQSVYTWAGPIMDAVDGAFGMINAVIISAMPPGAVQSLIINGISAGVGGVLVFLPQILILFLFIAILEDCGYMARAAFLLDRWMTKIGIGGKAFIPLLSSFACAVPGIMATRTIEDRRDRYVTILIAPLMSCSARLPVYVLFIALFVPATPLLGGLITLQVVTLLAMYMVGIVVAVPIALLLKRTVFKGPAQSFLLELPTFKWPSATTVLHRIYDQGREFVVSAGTIIFAVAIVVWALAYYPHPASIAADHDARRVDVRAEYEQMINNTSDGSSDAQAERDRKLSEINHSEAGTYLRESLLGRMGQWIEPVVEPLGWDWRIGTAVIASFPAREVVIATLGTIYNIGENQDETSTGLRQRLREAKRPDGTPMFNIAVALSIMVFFALCCQCAATLAIIRRETNSWKWPLITFVYMTTLAYVAAFATYRIALPFV